MSARFQPERPERVRERVRAAAVAAALACVLTASVPEAAQLSPGTSKRVSARVLQLVNEARSHARRCGREKFRAVPPLQLSGALAEAARDHAHDMARHNFFEHTGSDGSNPTERLARTGYRWRLAGENIAYGPETPEEVVKGWLDSPGHCENIMEPRYTEMGLAFEFGMKRRKGIYWVQTFAVPRKP